MQYSVSPVMCCVTCQTSNGDNDVVYEGSDSKGSSVNTSDSEDEQDDIDSDGPDDTGNHDADAAEAPVAPMSNHAQALAVVNSVVPSLVQPPWL